MRKSFAYRVVRFLFTLAVVAGAVWLVVNRQTVLDWWRLRTYTPPSTIARLADDDTMAGRGRDLFYASEPEAQDSADFNKSCPAKGEKTIVLGCYSAQRIYIYNVTDTRLDGVRQVTAAHEMLHAVYDRLSDAQKSDVNAMLKPVIDTMTDQRILELIKLYNQQEPGELYNEMHSILGTEYASLPPDLESYYKQYFSDRQKVVAYAAQYQAQFTNSQDQIDAYDQQLISLKTQIDQNNTGLGQQQAVLQTEADHLDQLRTKGDIANYNQAVPAYYADINSYNALIDQTKSLVAQYNTIVIERNQQVAAQNNLSQSLNSNYQPAAAQ